MTWTDSSARIREICVKIHWVAAEGCAEGPWLYSGWQSGHDFTSG